MTLAHPGWLFLLLLIPVFGLVATTVALRRKSRWDVFAAPRLRGALIRRSGGHAHPQLVRGALALDDNAGRFTLHDAPLALTAQEHRILAYLVHRGDAVVSRAELGEHVYEDGIDPDSNALDVLIGRVRRKIGAARLVTERGKGFRLVELP